MIRNKLISRSVLCLLLMLINFGFAQKMTENNRIYENEKLKLVIDSLKQRILNDTIKFNPRDLVHINGKTLNQKPYSMLYFVDFKYAYCLDNIDTKKVLEFVNEILEDSKILSIDILDKNHSSSIFGSMALNGVVMISTRKNSRINYLVAGLHYHKKHKKGNNFSQLPKNKPYVMIRT